jgi:hypothetical protein
VGSETNPRGVFILEAVDSSGIWKSRNGIIPILDDPTLTLSAHQWDKPPVINLEMTMHRVNIGQIGRPDKTLSDLLSEWRCVTEKQIRRLSSSVFNKGHKAGSRLRMLQKIGWFDGFWVQNSQGVRENIWMQGFAAHQYYERVLGVNHLQDPLQLLQNKDYALSLCAINELRMILEERGKVPDVTYAPMWIRPEKQLPFCTMVVDTDKGALTIYVDRITQRVKPVQVMRKKIQMYEEMCNENGGKLPGLKKGAAIIVWSVGSIQSIVEIVGSIDYLPEHMFQVFLVDECIETFPQSFFLAKKGKGMGTVDLQPFTMDLL